MEPSSPKKHRYVDEAPTSPSKRIKTTQNKENQHYDDSIDVNPIKALDIVRRGEGAITPRGRISPVKDYQSIANADDINKMVKGVVRIVHQQVITPQPTTLVGKLSGKSASKVAPDSKRVLINMKKMIGEGVFGNVWYAKLTEQNVTESSLFSLQSLRNPAVKPATKKVAVKGFDNEYDRELAVVESLIADKPVGVLRLHGILRHGLDQEPHLVMKFCNKGTAHEFFQNHVNNKKACYQKLIEVMEIIQSFHKAGYCHRDVHEKNFLLHQKKKNGEDQIFLSDFGHATKLIPGGGKIMSLRSRPLFMMNSPREIRLIFNDAEKRNNYVEYGRYLDAHGMEIDAYQIGMMIFRVAIASMQYPLLPAMENPHQRIMVDAIDHSLKDPLHPFDAYTYLEARHSEIPFRVAQIIAGLLTSDEPMSIEQAIKSLKNFLK